MSYEWAAGLFEGEGCLFKDKRYNTWTIQLRMTDLDIVQRFADIINTGNSVREETLQPSRQGNRKPCYRWSCSRKSEIQRILLNMLPYFGQRRAYNALNCLDDYDEHEFNRRTKTICR